MQEKIPHDVLKTFYDAATETLRLEPWTIMDESDNFSVRNEPEGERFYACVLGAAGINRGIVFYRGANGWATLGRIRRRELGAADALQELDALTVDFEPWKHVDPESRKRLKRFGFGAGDALLPCPFVYRPGKQPAQPDAAQMQDMIGLLRSSLPVFSRCGRTPGWLEKKTDGTLFHVLPGGDTENPAGEWLAPPEFPKPETEALPPDELMIARVKGKALRSCGPWEIHAGDSGAAVGTAKKAYRPLIATFVDSASGFVAGFTLGAASTMPATLPGELLKAMLAHLSRPEAFHVKRDDVAVWLEATARKLGIPVVRKTRLPQAEMAQESIQEFMGRGKG